MFKTSKSLSQQYEQLKAFIAHLKSQCIRHRDNTRNVKTTVDELLPLLKEAEARLADVPLSLVTYAQQQEDDLTYNVASELDAIRTAVQGRIDWIVTNVHRDAETGALTERLLNVDGTVTNLNIDPATADVAVAEIQIIIDMIE